MPGPGNGNASGTSVHTGILCTSALLHGEPGEDPCDPCDPCDPWLPDLSQWMKRAVSTDPRLPLAHLDISRLCIAHARVLWFLLLAACPPSFPWDPALDSGRADEHPPSNPFFRRLRCIFVLSLRTTARMRGLYSSTGSTDKLSCYLNSEAEVSCTKAAGWRHREHVLSARVTSLIVSLSSVFAHSISLPRIETSPLRPGPPDALPPRPVELARAS